LNIITLSWLGSSIRRSTVRVAIFPYIRVASQLTTFSRYIWSFFAAKTHTAVHPASEAAISNDSSQSEMCYTHLYSEVDSGALRKGFQNNQPRKSNLRKSNNFSLNDRSCCGKQNLV
jgi:hypothetical protein